MYSCMRVCVCVLWLITKSPIFSLNIHHFQFKFTNYFLRIIYCRNVNCIILNSLFSFSFFFVHSLLCTHSISLIDHISLGTFNDRDWKIVVKLFLQLYFEFAMNCAFFCSELFRKRRRRRRNNTYTHCIHEISNRWTWDFECARYFSFNEEECVQPLYARTH